MVSRTPRLGAGEGVQRSQSDARRTPSPSGCLAVLGLLGAVLGVWWWQAAIAGLVTVLVVWRYSPRAGFVSSALHCLVLYISLLELVYAIMGGTLAHIH